MHFVIFKRSSIALAIAALIGIISVAQDPGSASSGSSPLSLKIRPTSSSVKAGDTVWVEATMENKADHVVWVSRVLSEDQGGVGYKVDVWDAKGEPLPLTEYAKRLGGVGSAFEKLLRPAETIADRVNVSKLYDLSGPGRYTIQFRRFDLDSKSFLRSNTVTVTVAR
jgi:hypothetical protein